MNTQLPGQDKIVEIVRERYRLGDVVKIGPVPAAHQRRHRKLLLETSAGRFVVKTYKHDPHVLDALRFQHRLTDHLIAHGLPLPRIRRAKGGRRVIVVDDWAFEVQEYIPGESMRATPGTLAAAAGTLGKFHEVCRDFPRPPRDARMWRFSNTPRNRFAELFDRAKQLQGQSRELMDQCNAIGLFLHEAGAALSMDKRDSLETGLIHGDWHGGNLLFQDERLVAIIDLEFAGEGCYLEDLACAISNLCLRTTAHGDQLTARADLLLNRYQDHRALSYAEELALYHAVGVKHIATVCFQMTQLNGVVAGLNAAQWMTLLDKQCKWLAKRAEQARRRT